MLSLMQPGEEYTVIQNELESTILGKQEVQDLDHLQVHNEDVGFEFPHLGNETLAKLFGRKSEVGIQVNNCERTLILFTSIKTSVCILGHL